MNIYIYALIDPRDGSPFYVGKTNKPKLRLKGHRSGRGITRCANFIREIKSLGLRIDMEILEECNESNWIEREDFWIKKFIKEFGVLKILNSASAGAPGLFKEISPETKERLRNMFLGRPIPEQQRAQISKSLTGLKQSKETVLKRLNTINERRKEKGLPPLMIHESRESSQEEHRKRSRERRRLERQKRGCLKRGSEELKKLISERTKVAMDSLPEEKKIKMGNAHRGKMAWNRGKAMGPFSPERRRLQSERLKSYLATLTPEQREQRMFAARKARRSLP